MRLISNLAILALGITAILQTLTIRDLRSQVQGHQVILATQAQINANLIATNKNMVRMGQSQLAINANLLSAVGQRSRQPTTPNHY